MHRPTAFKLSEMKHAKAAKQFTHVLDGLQGGIALYRDGIDEFLLSHGYRLYRDQLEAIKADLCELGLYEIVREALVRSEELVREAKYDEAQALVLEANIRLSRSSGAEDDLKRLYTAAND
jgi:hypothetical protein